MYVYSIMHKTLHPDMLGFIDSKPFDILVQGWCFHKEITSTVHINPLRVLIDGIVKGHTTVERPDVAKFYNNNATLCGWSFRKELTQSYKVQVYLDTLDVWETVFEEKGFTAITTIRTTEILPSFLVVDNFYEDPDYIRKFALQQTLVKHPNNHKGIRSDGVFRFPGLKERFERLLGTKIRAWEHYGTNGCFQINVAGEQAVYHSDGQTYAGVIFLTPNAPGSAGTQFFRSKDGIRKTDDSNYSDVFKGGYYDSTRFEKMDVVGNVYNRLVLFDAKLIHAADTYFGKEKEDGRLIQLFFFDLDI